MKFNSLKELAKFANSTTGQEKLLSMHSKQIEKLLINATRELEGYLKEGLQRYFDSYTPVEYRRTGQTVQDIKLGMPMQISTGVWEIGIDMNSPHNSLFGDEDGNTLSLINTGWVSKGLEDQIGEVEHFTRFEGTNYVQEAVDRFNKNNRYGMSVKVLSKGKDVTGFSYNYGR